MNGKLNVVRGVAGAVLACAALASVGAGSAFAESVSSESVSPWWNVNAATSPAELPEGGEGQIEITAIDVGDGEADGSGTPITLSDRLPAGVVPVAVSGGVGPNGSYGAGECSLETVSCTFDENVPSFFNVVMAVKVKIEAGAVSGALNEAVIEGGGAQRVVSRPPLEIGDAPPKFGVEAYELTPEDVGGYPDVQAGSHPFQLTTTINLSRTEESGEAEAVALPKDLHFNLPAGLVGDPSAIPQCTAGEFSTEVGFHGNLCPPNTAIGVASVSLMIKHLLPRPATVPVPVFNVAPQVGEAARFGFTVSGTPVYLDVSLRTGGDYGVEVDVRNISQNTELVGSKVTLWGVPGDPRHNQARGWNCVYFGFSGTGPCAVSSEASTSPFLTLPTSCAAPWTSTMTADSWVETAVLRPAEYTLRDTFGQTLGLTGCNRLSFEPTITATPDGQAASTPSGLTVGIHVPQEASLNPTGDAEAGVKDTTVTLPVGIALNPSAADGLLACSTEQVGLESATPISCPEASKVGTVEIHTPLLPNPLTGAAYLAQQNANPFGSLIALYVVVRDPVSGVLVKLAGKVTPNPVTGQLVSTFEETPEVPFEELNLNFFGGSRAPLSTPPLCGSYQTTASITPWSGNAPVESSSRFDITSGPNGVPCTDPRPFEPGFEAGMTSIQAGGYSPLTVTMTRPDADQTLGRLSIQLPPGLLGALSRVKLCEEPQASVGACGPESLIGHVTASAGLGGDPYTVEGGQVFITGPYDGAPFGLSILEPAVAGPFDLGTIVVRAKIDVDPTNAQIMIVSDPLPTIKDGIPLEIQHVNVLTNRPEFTFDPTNCSPMTVTAELESGEGAKSTVSSPFQVTNCAVLAFNPKFTVSTSGKTSHVDGASLVAKVVFPAGAQGSHANVAKVKVELPKQLPARLTTLQKACTEKVFAANPAECPSASKIGEARVTTPILAGVVSGPVYFVSHGGAKYPELIAVLTGEDGVTVQVRGETFISKAGITSSTFPAVPDVPFSTFELVLPEGPYSALAANGNLCKSSLVMPTEFVAQNGAQLEQSTKIAVTGCPKAKPATHKKKKGKKGKKGKKVSGKRGRK